MTMNIIQEQTIKATELISTMQCAAGSDRWKREVVGIWGAGVAEPADSIQGYGVCDGVSGRVPTVRFKRFGT